MMLYECVYVRVCVHLWGSSSTKWTISHHYKCIQSQNDDENTPNIEFAKCDNVVTVATFFHSLFISISSKPVRNMNQGEKLQSNSRYIRNAVFFHQPSF